MIIKVQKELESNLVKRLGKYPEELWDWIFKDWIARIVTCREGRQEKQHRGQWIGHNDKTLSQELRDFRKSMEKVP